MTDTLFADVSEFQVPVDDTYPYQVLSIRVSDGTYLDHNFAANYGWMRHALDTGRLTFGIVYTYCRPNWQANVNAVIDAINAQGGLHPRVALMLDVESSQGNPHVDSSGWLNSLYWALAEYAGSPARIIGYGNTWDLDGMWPQKPPNLRLIVASYGTNPDYPGKVAHQYTDGSGYGGGLPEGCPPFGRCDMNSADGLTAQQFAAACGITTAPVVLTSRIQGGAMTSPTSGSGAAQPSQMTSSAAPAARHAVLTFAGTFAAPGTGYPSDVVHQANPALVFEVPVIAPWSFGPIPPGSVTAPSYAESVGIAVDFATRWITDHPTQTFALGGYSQGAEAASRVLATIMSGGLQWARPNLIGGYTFGNPWRGLGHTFPGGTDPGGRGIAPVNLTQAQIPRDANNVDTWWDFANPGDLYTTTPNDAAGADITAVYEAAVQLGIDHNLIAAELAALLGQGGLGQQVLGLLTHPLIGGPALVEAIIRTVAFVDTNPPMLPHISYHVVDALPGQTSVAVAVGHLNTIAAATAAQTAA